MKHVLIFEAFVDAKQIASLIALTKNVANTQVDDNVKKLQTLLIQAGHLPKQFKNKAGVLSSAADGIKGSRTRKAIAAYQQQNGGGAVAAPAAAEAKPKESISSFFNLKQEADFLTQPASLFFDGKTLSWVVNGQAKKTWDAISGNTFMSAGTRYDSETHGGKYVKLSDKGPLPEGKYSINGIQHQKREDNNFIKQAIAFYTSKSVGAKNFEKGSGARFAWGDSRCAIKSTAGTDTFGRHSFYIHGGAIAGSSGCIDLTGDMDDFAKTYGAYLAHGNKPLVPLTVKYWK